MMFNRFDDTVTTAKQGPPHCPPVEVDLASRLVGVAVSHYNQWQLMDRSDKQEAHLVVCSGQSLTHSLTVACPYSHRLVSQTVIGNVNDFAITLLTLWRPLDAI